MAQYEIEIKSLLGSSQKAEEVKKQLFEKNPTTVLLSKQKQLNHYFTGGNLKEIPEALLVLIPPEKKEEFLSIVEKGKDFSVRTRQVDDKDPLFIVKASLDEGSSHNTVSRIEFETPVKGMNLNELDELLLKANFLYQAKWSREREEYQSDDIVVCFDKNAGYGYLAEFEKVVDDENALSDARKRIEDFMKLLGVVELPQERLERMFSYYNKNWQDYYGTEKIFNIE